MSNARMVRLLVLGNGAAGAEKQAFAFGERLRRKLLDPSLVCSRFKVVCPPVECVRVALGSFRCVPPTLQLLGAHMTRNPFFGYQKQDVRPLRSMSKDSVHALDIVIGCGRSTVALCAMMKQRQPATTFNVQIQHPRVPLALFDAVIAPRHDFPRGKRHARNVFLTSGSIHDITPKSLPRRGRNWSDEFDTKLRGRRTRIVWLLGGPCRGFPFTEQDAEAMVDQFVRGLPCDDDVAVLVTFSRRTPPFVQKLVRRRLTARFPVPGHLLVYEGTERPNPYTALLATASCIVITPDSISMTTEAIASRKPVFILGVEMCKGKFARFHEFLFESKATAPFTAAALHRREAWAPSGASVAFEHEITVIVNTIARDIHQVLEQRDGRANKTTRRFM
ncbi:hypothetical protein PsorP6_005549 [Peronosclerospora sorghi]|uniref:Uncharacterized protein n=1 Tax=Peronosclerospora sorghi TaxID=230839 RepID=A0ACC0W2X9_9STRA|nr:hypothetical protein PsorP6_005549 [Peronosclerospora sorghi]